MAHAHSALPRGVLRINWRTHWPNAVYRTLKPLQGTKLSGGQRSRLVWPSFEECRIEQLKERRRSRKGREYQRLDAIPVIDVQTFVDPWLDSWAIAKLIIVKGTDSIASNVDLSLCDRHTNTSYLSFLPAISIKIEISLTLYFMLIMAVTNSKAITPFAAVHVFSLVAFAFDTREMQFLILGILCIGCA